MAATGIVSGVDGGATFATGYVAEITSWTLNIIAEVVDTTGLGSAWKTKIAGVKDWNGTFTCIVNSASFSSLGVLGVGEDPATLELIFDATATTDGKYSGTAMISNTNHVAQTASGAQIFTFDFEGSDTLSLTAAA